jgi:hypothetical protein
LNAANGVPFLLDSDFVGIYKWDKNLIQALHQNKIYDFTLYHKRHKVNGAAFAKEYDFMVRRYLKPSPLIRSY